ncbi:bifunctional diguanylate cyclase/phosphodiesterase [Myxosarcina sp. GI1]|uniref:putative bifunctional diguanylate cyclase/phosphodiesterase n=1 Tax=Myxosarcina sp. GI1 TaxID=1541065 RepID=UPI000565ACF0|nr:bifunctional diguanylate cyclase/phosphodiesterase [Myxosarcina sp. GI1]
MNYRRLKLYAVMSRLRFPKTYRGKIMSIAFIGTHVPLLTLFFYAIISGSLSAEATVRLIIIALIATLIGTLATLCVLNYLLYPITLTSQVLRQYTEEQTLIDLPTKFKDEVGTLMADTAKTLEKLDKAIEYLANYDKLTDLPNKKMFRVYLQQAIYQTSRETQFALIVLSIDNLKSINSAFGHKIGDLLIQKVAIRIARYLNVKDILSRYSDCEFAILQKNTNYYKLTLFARTLLEAISKPYSLLGQKIHGKFNLGITIYPVDGVSGEQLLQNTDNAVHQAKQQATNTYQFYSAESNDLLRRRLIYEENLRYALRRNELIVHYQPRVDVANGRLVSVEALLRWQSPELGAVSPSEFIPIAEESNLIETIGEWVLLNACKQNKQWQQEGLPPLRVSVNLSPYQLRQNNLVEIVERVLIETGLEANYLELEITESSLMEKLEAIATILRQLKSKGISLALDDFGTGFSSLSYLQKLPLDTLKIDRSFVINVASNPSDAAISRAIVALAQSLELNIAAEGVETQAQFDFIQNQGCHEVQGYYFSEPLSAYNLRNFLLTYQAQNQTVFPRV